MDAWGPLNARRGRGGSVAASATATAASAAAERHPAEHAAEMDGAGGDDFVTEERDKDGRTRRVLHHRVRASDTLQGLAIQFSVTVRVLHTGRDVG